MFALIKHRARTVVILGLITLFVGSCSKRKNEPSSQKPSATTIGGSNESLTAGSGNGSGAGSGSGSGSGVGSGSGAGSGSEPAQPTSENFLSLVSGAYLVQQPANDRAFDHNPINLIFDGALWRSPEGQVANHVFVIETPGITTLTSVGFDTHHMFYTTEENARTITLEASNTSAVSGYQSILQTTLAQESAISTFPVTASVPARWFRLTVKDNHGSASATALKRIFGYGSQQLAPMPTNLTGTYRVVDPATNVVEASNDADIFVKQTGTIMQGCWRATGTFSGGLTGPVATLEWAHPDLGKNTALMVSTTAKRVVLWRLKSGGFWAFDTFERVTSDVEKCGDGSSLTAEGGLAKELADSGRAVVYGINFDFNSDKLRAESKVILDKIVAILLEHPDWKMTIEGHTDSIGGVAFNQTLSTKRANAVVAYLTAAKVSADRLSASGLGASSPIDSNETDIGRARNRRVVLVK